MEVCSGAGTAPAPWCKLMRCAGTAETGEGATSSEDRFFKKSEFSKKKNQLFQKKSIFRKKKSTFQKNEKCGSEKLGALGRGWEVWEMTARCRKRHKLKVWKTGKKKMFCGKKSKVDPSFLMAGRFLRIWISYYIYPFLFIEHTVIEMHSVTYSNRDA